MTSPVNATRLAGVRGAAGQPSALHVNDAAFTAAHLITEARRRGYTWDFLPKAAPAQQWRGLTGQARRAAIGAAWVARLRLLAARHDIVHVHSASTLGHARLGAPRFVVHCHGTDVRTAQYQPRWTKIIRAGLRDAEAVLYSTPDLAEHVLPHRSDAIYLPVPIDVRNIPEWAPVDGRPSVVFASRWTADKDGDVTQLDVAKEVVAAVGDRADVVGIDWGTHAGQAAALGVRLVPRGDHADYLRLLAGAHVVVGQSAGILAASELEALAIGAPVVIGVPLPLYADDPPPVFGCAVSDGAVSDEASASGDVSSTAEAVRALLDGTMAHDPAVARRWVADRHGVEHAVDTVARVHRDVVTARR